MAEPTLMTTTQSRPTRSYGQDAAARATTHAARCEAVERAICVMHERLAEPVAHEEMARAALLSQYHFNRVFRLVTGVSPGRYLTAVRMAEAKRLLLTTSMRVTEVCFAVGFESLGTFTTRFGQFVGVAPKQLRALVAAYGANALLGLVGAREPRGGEPATPGTGDADLRGWLEPPAGVDCFAMVGLFPATVPQCLPVACATVWAPDRFSIGAVPAGLYSILAVGFPGAGTVRAAMMKQPSELLVGEGAIRIGAHDLPARLLLRLRPPSPLDPPVVLAGPLLAASAQAQRTTLAGVVL